MHLGQQPDDKGATVGFVSHTDVLIEKCCSTRERLHRGAAQQHSDRDAKVGSGPRWSVSLSRTHRKALPRAGRGRRNAGTLEHSFVY